MKSKIIVVTASLLLVVGLLVGVVACAQPAPTTPTTPTAPAAPAQPEKLKVACIYATNWPLGLDALHMVEIDVDSINNAGGLELGGKKYLFDVIFYDNKMDFAMTKTLGEKAIHQDKVDFITSDPWALPLFQMCEDNEVVGVITCYDVEINDPELHWVVGGSNGVTTYPAFILWAAEQYPELKTMVGIYPDRHDGRLTGEQQRELFAPAAGLEVLEMIYYPPDATDVSAVGTKIKHLNPDMIVPFGGGPQLDAGIMKAAYAAGWRGQIVGCATMPGMTLLGIAGGDALEGGVFECWPAEFEPATTPEAAKFKADYIARFGEWNDPEPTIAIAWYGLKAGLIEADSVDKSKVMEALYKPIQIECALGTIARFPRLDQNNPKCVDAIIGDLPIKTFEGGQVKRIGTFTVEQALDYMKRVYGAW